MKKITTTAYMPTEIEIEQISDNVAKIIAYPFEKGYGVTLAHPLRRLLFMATAGYAATGLKIQGVKHEFDSMRGMLEDVTVFIVNLKNLRFKLKDSAQRAVVEYKFKGPKEITGKDLNNNEISVVNPDEYLATINEDAELKFSIIIEQGVGYMPSELIRSELDPSYIALDAFFTPVKQAVYEIENVLVEDSPDFEKINLTITTDGQISPVEAFKNSLEAMYKQLSIFNKVLDLNLSNISNSAHSNAEDSKLFESIETLNLSARSSNSLERANIAYIGEIAMMNETELKEIKNLGKKSLEEIKDIMSEIGYPMDKEFSQEQKEKISRKIQALKDKKQDE